MKSIFDMKGPERAAALLVALGKETAAEILRQMDEKDIELLSGEMARIHGLSENEREDLIGEFFFDLKKVSAIPQGGEKAAIDLLSRAFGPEKAREVVDRMHVLDVEHHYSLLEECDPEILAAVLNDEQPQTIAVALSHMTPKQSGQVMRNLDREKAGAVALRMAKMTGVSPEIAARVALSIKKRYDEYNDQHGLKNKGEGMSALVDILNSMSGGDEMRLMKNLRDLTPELSDQILDHIFTFENVVNLNNNEMRIVIDEIGDDRLIALALKGAGDEIRFKFLRNTSRNRATDILDEMEAMGAVRLADVEDARSEIVGTMRYLSDNSIISLVRDKETFVE